MSESDNLQVLQAMQSSLNFLGYPHVYSLERCTRVDFEAMNSPTPLLLDDDKPTTGETTLECMQTSSRRVLKGLRPPISIMEENLEGVYGKYRASHAKE